MKKIIWLIVFSLITFQLLGQQQKQQQLNLKKKDYWDIEYKNEMNLKDKTKIYIIDTVDHCKKITYTAKPKTYIINNKDVCIVDKTKSEYIINDRFYDGKPTKQEYIYNFNGHISGSIGINIADLNISKVRLEYERDTKTQNWTVGAILNLYTLKYYYNGYRAELFTRYYFVPNTSGDGAFLQLRAGSGGFHNPINNKSFISSGLGFDVGKKMILTKSDNYKDVLTLTPMGGIQFYNTPDGLITPSWVWQLRFGYQF